MTRCDSNQRCEVCPIQHLPEASDRVKAGNVVRSATRILANGDPQLHQLSTIRIVCEDQAAYLNAEELESPIIGAVALNLAGQCKAETVV